MDALAEFGASHLAGTARTFRDALVRYQETINALNVYPVPDGDTGTNMALTMESVVSEIDELGDGASMADVCRAVAHGSLMGARGNSGVILSQLLRGLSGELAGVDSASAPIMVAGLRAASVAADAAVLRPVEGTILSVARAAADAAAQAVGIGSVTSDGSASDGSASDGSASDGSASDGSASGGSASGGSASGGLPGDVPGEAAVASDGAGGEAGLVDVLAAARSSAADALDRTPRQLAVLARAGVVDAGGAGYVLLLDAMLHSVDGRPVPPPPAPAGSVVVGAGGSEAAPTAVLSGVDSDEAVTDLRYEVMYLLEAPDDTMAAFKDVWAGLGDSIVVVGGDGLWNCHIHTDDVGGAIEAALDAGRPRDIRVTDLREQVDEVRWVREGTVTVPDDEASGAQRKTAVVAVANGDGIRRIFRSLGVHHFVAGGQSMNPSTAQILDVVAQVAAPEVVLLPNNDNIHPVARQVCALADRPVRVVPTGSIVEGFAALLEYDPEAGADVNASAMAASARRIVAGEVVRAVRDANGPDGPVHVGDWLGLSRQGIEVVEDSVVAATTSLVAKLLTDGHELVTLIEGDVALAGDTRRVTEWLAEHRPDVAVEVHHGGQPLYPYLISIE